MSSAHSFIKYKNKIVFNRLNLTTFNRVPKDYIENESCFIFVNKGDFFIRAPEEKFDLDPTSAILGKCVNFFYERTSEQNKKNPGVEAIAIFLYPKMIEELFDFDLRDYSYNLNFNFKQIEVNNLLKNFRDGLNILLDNPELVDEKLTETKLKEFVFLLSRLEQAPSHFEFLSGLFDPQQVLFKNVIQANLFSNLSLKELARLCDLSLSSFKRKFQEIYKQTPKKYINLKKIEKATKLLKDKNIKIIDISFSCGFDSLSSFNRNFLHLYQKSPGKYRSELK